MSEERSPTPRIVATRNGYRLVHQPRDAQLWPNVSDLTLERLDHDATRETRWIRVESWCLSAQNGRPFQPTVVALKMLLDPGPVVDEKP